MKKTLLNKLICILKGHIFPRSKCQCIHCLMTLMGTRCRRCGERYTSVYRR